MDYVCTAWFERDRKHIMLEAPSLKEEIFSLWDEEIDQAIDDGFLTVPRHPRPTGVDWLPHALTYARTKGLIK